jgi:tetratricopeptide (TPR) repeat protein
VQEVLKDQMNVEIQRLWAERAVRAISNIFPNPEYTNWNLCRRYLLHAQACSALIEQWELLFTEAARLLNRVGYYLWQRGEYELGEPLYQRALAIKEKSLPPDHPDTATTLENYAYLLREMKRTEEAAKLEERARAIRAKRSS